MIYISEEKLALHENLKRSFNKVKEELADHLEAINENTNEINANYEYLLELDMKIEKLNEKVEEIYLMLKSRDNPAAVTPEEISLTLKEQEIFMLLYARNGDLIDYREIARVLGLTEELVVKHVSSIASKGVPIIKKYVDERVCLVLDIDFRNRQAKENIIKISDSIKRSMHFKKLI